MPSSLEEENLSCNDEPESEAHCNHNACSQNSETNQAVGGEPQVTEKSSPGSPAHSEANSAGNSYALSIQNKIEPIAISAESLPSREYEDINDIMAFSDAEEDQPNKKQNLQNGHVSINNNEEMNGDIQEEADTTEPLAACSLPNGTAIKSTRENSATNNNPTSDTKECPPGESAGAAESNEDLDSEKVMEKLQQIQDYMNQTSKAMKALEKEGNLDKLEQYKTLGKVMKDLNTSKEKLVARLVKLEAKTSDVESTNDNQEQGNSQRVGIVGSMDEVVNPLSMQERLARHETEQGVLSTRLRESVAKRQELVARYKNTRERLNNLKKQRQGLVQEERSLLQSQGGPQDVYEDTIPDADTWTIDQLKQAIVDFKGLKNKVVHLQSLYETQVRTADPDDEETMASIERKREKVNEKRTQLDNVLSQLNDILKKKLEEGGNEIQPELNGEVGLEMEEDVLTGAVAVGEALSESTGDILASSDITAKQEHLNKLKAQLSNMKKLLDETQSIRLANVADLERRKERMETEKRPDLLPSAEQLPESDVIKFNGQILHLTQEQKSDPQIWAKSQRLREAKQRLAKMEEVMAMISLAREQNKPLNEVLTPEYMSILEDAQNDLEGSPENIESNHNIQKDEIDPPPQSSIIQAPVSSDVHMDYQPSVREAEPIRNATMTAAVTKPVQNAKPKDPHKMHNRNIWNDEATNSDPLDPRVNELLNLQQDLHQKKNTLEVLMNTMGKSSSFMEESCGNISGGNSESDEVLRSWNMDQPARPFKNGDVFSEAQANETRERLPVTENNSAQKYRNKLDTTQRDCRRHSSASIYNCNASHGVRPKIQPNDGSRLVPNASWEIPADKNYSIIQNTEGDVQKMMSNALSQLNGLQQTVNHLYTSIRQTKQPTLDHGFSFPGLASTYPPQQIYPGVMPSLNLQGMYNPYQYYDQRSNDVNTSSQVMGLLQQCLSQLNVHSLELQSLSKQLQLLTGRREKGLDNIDKNLDKDIFQLSRPSNSFDGFRFNQQSQQNAMRDEVHAQSNEQAASYCPPPARRMPSYLRANNHGDLDLDSQNFNTPFDGCIGTNAANHVDRINASRAMQQPAPGFVSMQPLQSQSTSILNNKVLPGTRANNYWDNFRSYSHQNPLSSTRKSNSRGDNFSGPIHQDARINSIAKEPIQACMNRLDENRRQNITSRRNNQVNRASEKNTFSMKPSVARGKFSPAVMAPQPQYSSGRRAKNENHREGRLLQTTSRDTEILPNFSYSNLQVRNYDDYRASGGVCEDKSYQGSRTEVLKQAESLLQKQHPQFLLKLFSYLSKITDNTDQHVALELLKELSNQDISLRNQWMSSMSSLNTEDYQPIQMQKRDQVTKNESATIDKVVENILPTTTDFELSEAFNCIGGNIQTKEVCGMYNNLASGGVDHSVLLDTNQAGDKHSSPVPTSNNSSFYTPIDHGLVNICKRSKDRVNFFDTSCRLKNKSPELSIIGNIDIAHNVVDTNNLGFQTSPKPNIGIKPAQTKSLPTVTIKNQNAFVKTNTKNCPAPKEVIKKEAIGPRLSNENTFDSIISAVFRKIMDYFKSMADTREPSDRFLEGLHLSILRVIEGLSKKSYSPDLFASIENRLRRTLHCFKGKRISEIQQELPAAVSQVLIHQYCAYLFQHNTESYDMERNPHFSVQIGQSNLDRQTEQFDPQNREIIDNNFTKTNDKISTSVRRNTKDVKFPPTADSSKFPVRRLANQKFNQVNNKNGFEVLPFEYFDDLIDSPVGDEPEGTSYSASSFGRSNGTNKQQWNNPMHQIRNNESNVMSEFISLPVHDLAEADQSREKPNPELEDALSFELGRIHDNHFDMFDMATGYSGAYRQEKVPEQGLDEVPTKLGSPLQLPAYDDEDDDLPEAFEELTYRRSPVNGGLLSSAKFSMEHHSGKE